MITEGEFISRALWTPFERSGRTYEGWDCWGVIYRAYHDVLGIEIPSYVDQYIDAGESRQGCEILKDLIGKNMDDWRKVKDEDWRWGDVCLFAIWQRPIHVGLVLDNRTFLHSEKKVNTIIERYSSPMWKGRREGVYRYAG